MPSVEFSTKGVSAVVSGHDKITKAFKSGAKEQLDVTKQVSKAQLESSKQAVAAGKKQASEETKQAKKKEAAWRNSTRVVQNAIRAQETEHDKLKRKIREVSRAVKQTGQDEGIIAKEKARLIVEYNKKVDKQGGLVRGVKKDTGDLGEQAKTTFDPTRLLKYAAGFATVSKAVTLITNELRTQQGLIDKAEQTKLPIAAAQNVLRRNLLSMPIDEQTRIIAEFTKIAQETTIPESAIQIAGAQAVSGSGGDIQAAINTTRYVAPIFADRPSEIGDVVQATLNLSGATGTMDPKVNFGALMQTAALSNVSNARQQATSIGPALVGINEFGGSIQGAGSLFAAMTVGGAETTGRLTGTAAIKLAKQLEGFDFGAEASGKALGKSEKELEKSKSARDKIRASQKQEGLPGAEATFRSAKRINRVTQGMFDEAIEKQQMFAGFSLTERIQFLQTNTEDAKAFIGGASFETKSLAPIRQLLTKPESVTARKFKSGLTQFSPETLDALADRAQESLLAGALEPSAMFNRAMGSSVERQRANAPIGVTSENRDVFRELLQRAGRSALGSSADDFLLGAGGDNLGTVTPSELIGALQRRRSGLLSGTDIAGDFAMEGFTLPPTKSDISDAAAIKETIDVLVDAIEKSNRAQLESQERQTKATEDVKDAIEQSEGILVTAT